MGVGEGGPEPELGLMDSQVLFPAVVPFLRTPLHSSAPPSSTFSGMRRPAPLLWAGEAA